jgi:hypothetical protein
MQGLVSKLQKSKLAASKKALERHGIIRTDVAGFED